MPECSRLNLNKRLLEQKTFQMILIVKVDLRKNYYEYVRKYFK